MINFYSFNGYGNAIAFSELTTDDFKEIETYVQKLLPSLCEETTKETGNKYNLKEKSWFFGMFGVKPESFYLTGGETKLIQKAIAKVNEFIIRGEVGHYEKDEYFKTKGRISYEHNMCESIFGLVFGDMRQIKKVETERKSTELRNNLFERARELVIKYESDELKPVQNFTVDSVQVTMSSAGKFHGQISCAFCTEDSEIKVFYKSTGTGSWIISNLIAHMNRYHHTDGMNIVNKKPHKTSGYITKPYQNDNCHEKQEKKTIELNIEPIGAQAVNNLVFQMKQQVIKMSNCAAKSKETIEEVVLNDSKKEMKSMKFCQVRGEGDCLFLSLSHQLYGHKIDSEEHNLNAVALRGQVVDHILIHLADFQHEIKGRLICDNGKQITNIENDCIDFVTKKLSKQGYFGGSESIKAISRIYKCNIIIVYDDGSCKCGYNFSSTNEKSIFIFHHDFLSHKTKKQVVKESDNPGNHFDSIVGISDKQLDVLAKEIICTANKNFELFNEELHISIN